MSKLSNRLKRALAQLSLIEPYARCSHRPNPLQYSVPKPNSVFAIIATLMELAEMGESSIKG